MSTADNASYFSRFLLKFVEIIAAGLATAASGYLIAHLSATLSSSAPPAGTAVVATPNPAMTPVMPAQPTPAGSADAQQPSVPPPELNAPRSTQAATAPSTPSVTKPEAPSRRVENGQKPAAPPRDRESWAVRVRAALANAARHPDPPEASPHRGITRAPAADVQPRPVPDANPNGLGAAAPAGTELRPPPLQQTTIIADPPPVAEVNPVAPIQPSAAPPSTTDSGALSKLEQMLRNDPLAGSEQAPRPPLPVGQD